MTALWAVTISGCVAVAPDTAESSAALDSRVLCNEVFSQTGAAALAACIARVAPGGIVAVPAGSSIVLENTVVIDKSLILTTDGKQAGQLCDPRAGADGCATIHASPTSPAFNDPAQNPAFKIVSSDVSLRNLDFDFHLRTTGIQVVAGIRFSAFDSSFQNALRSALEVGAGVAADIERNLIFNNGAHVVAQNLNSDGLTLLAGSSTRIVGNQFLDNTDVQLIVGTCPNCVIANNDIRNSGNPARSAFAAVALHSFHGTQNADFTGSDITGNVIDCSPGRSCGFGIYLGDYAWFPNLLSNPVNGGHIHGNSISNAQIGMYIDHAVNTRIDDDNGFFIPGGVFPCLSPPAAAGRRYVAAVLSLVEDPRVGGLVQLDFSTALNLFVNHKFNQNLNGCIPNGF